MSYITTKDGTQIFYKDWGTGQPLFFHHGWPLSADDWDAQLMFFLARGYRVIAHDRRGHGRSTQTDKGHDMDTYAADVAELVAALDLKNSIHIGHSTGGGEVTRYVARHGKGRVVKAVLISAIPPHFQKSDENPDGVPKEVVDAIRDGTANHRSQFYIDVTLPFYGFNRPGATVVEGIQRNWWRQGMMGSIKAQYECVRVLAETDFHADLASIDIPVLVMHGEDDRLPVEPPSALRPPKLRPVDPRTGWLVERWHPGKGRDVPAAPFGKYTGDPAQAFWEFDEESARANQDYLADQIGKKPQLLAWVQDGQRVAQTDTHNQVTLRFEPEADGVTFHVAGTCLDAVEGGAKNLARWTGLPVGAPLGHAAGGGPVNLSRITGPVVKTGPDTFALALDRSWSTRDTRNPDIWLLASHPGDGEYKSAVQQALMHVARNTGGTAQHLKFPEIPDQPSSVSSIPLAATSDAGATVRYYVREGPAEVDGDKLRPTPIPPGARFPIKVTVVAWQWGHAAEPKLDTAEPVERTFSLFK